MRQEEAIASSCLGGALKNLRVICRQYVRENTVIIEAFS